VIFFDFKRGKIMKSASHSEWGWNVEKETVGIERTKCEAMD
jgi:hypothetical protein